jgi:hypothetical protein
MLTSSLICRIYGRRTSPDFERRLGRVLDTIRDRFLGGCHIFLGDYFDPTDGQGDIEHAPITLPRWPDGEAVLNEYNHALREVASHRTGWVHVIGLRQAFAGHGIHHGSQAYWYFYNLEDPNDEGYEAIGRLYEAALAAVLKS